MADRDSNDRPDNPGDAGGNDPFSEMFARMFGGQTPGGIDPKDLPEQLREALGGGNDPEAMNAMLRQAQAMMGAMASGSTGPVNWKLAQDTARQAVAGDDPSVSASRRAALVDAGRLAGLWLDSATAFEGQSRDLAAYSRAEWVEKTMQTWKTLTEPVAENVSRALSDALRDQMPEQLKPMLGGAQGMFQQMGGALFGMQLGGAVGTLAKDVLGATDIGLPLAGAQPALVPSNVAAFREGLDLPEQEVLLFVALRELAHTRLFARVPWLRSHVLGAIDDYARAIHIDVSGIEEAVRGMDPMNPESMQSALSEGLFSPQRTGAQEAALARLETALALIEGWVDEVVAAAAANLPSGPSLREMLRRRRAAGGPAEQAFASLVGLEMRPRRLRDAARLWAVLHEQRGVAGRDAVWEHPDLMPTAEDLDDPEGFGARRALAEATDDELDAALGKLLSGGYDEAADGPDRDGASEGTGDGAGDASGADEGDGGTGTGDAGGPGNGGDDGDGGPRDSA